MADGRRDTRLGHLISIVVLIIILFIDVHGMNISFLRLLSTNFYSSIPLPFYLFRIFQDPQQYPEYYLKRTKPKPYEFNILYPESYNLLPLYFKISRLNPSNLKHNLEANSNLTQGVT